MSSKDTDEKRVMHSKIDNMEIMIKDKPDEVIEETFQSFLSIYQIGLKTTVILSFIGFIYCSTNVIK